MRVELVSYLVRRREGKGRRGILLLAGVYLQGVPWESAAGDLRVRTCITDVNSILLVPEKKAFISLRLRLAAKEVV